MWNASVDLGRAWSTAEQKAAAPAHSYLQRRHSAAIYVFTQCCTLTWEDGRHGNSQVLIPPYEVFRVFDGGGGAGVTYRLESNLNCVYDRGSGSLHPISASPADMWLGLLVLLLPSFLHGFKPLLSSDSITHRVISQRAILRKTAEVCRDIALSAGQVFPLTIDDSLTAGAVEKACSPGTSSSFFSTLKFQVAIESIYFSNGNVDFIFALSAKHHFDDETFQEGRAIITAGKCSHGGFFDRTSRRDPVGGINKDTVKSSHGLRHRQAADLAVLATMDLLEEIRVIVGDRRFLQLMGLSQSSALCFVIDTTGSMSDDIAEAKRVSLDIIDRKRGTKEEPSAYILLALTAAPPSSEIFVFSDAPAKDTYLKSTVQALIETTKSVVNFMITDVTQRASRSLKISSTMQMYYDLAKASGGQAIQVSKSDLSQATEIIEDSSVSALVTVFQVVQDPGRAGEFTFPVDPSLINVTVYITGFPPLTFNLTSPSGVSQSSDQASGPLASFSTAGNLRRLRLHAGSQRGSWKIQVDSVNSYSVKLVDSDVFLVTFPDVPSGEYAVHLKGEDNTTASRSTPNIFQRQASTQIKTSGISLTAQANTTSIEPGASISVLFTVSASASGSGSCAAETLTVKSTNDRNYASSSPGSVTVAAGCGGAANGTVNLTVPANATSGTDVTLTIEAQNAAGTDINYAVLRFLVSAKVAMPTTNHSDITCPLFSWCFCVSR
ncbi:unnamed protein product [Tetraodon nigroviridis]|uniref:(spotted green pufferfish) hypothetical protein n=1 Tax=Tetraodon nigroviridis TaxID=99883 RepID=Q4RZQ1_TETNG|nr:unnamed protein product [Tetraodon nigroviridis]